MKNIKNNQTQGMKKLYALSEKRKLDLSLSENPLGCSPFVVETLKQINVSFNDYPDPNGNQLKNILAHKFDCNKKNIFIANGSEAIISIIPRVFTNPGDEVIVPQLTFPMFSICSELEDLTVIFSEMSDQLSIDLAAILKLINKKTKLIFLCNPNNPTGSVLSKKQLLDFVDQVPPSVLIVVDEANIEFGGESIIDQAIFRQNILVLRTFSKGFGLANLRIGFAVGSRELIEVFETETPLFPISGLSETLAITALQDIDFIAQTKCFMDFERSRIQTRLENNGFWVSSSEANNLFVQLPINISPDTFWASAEKAEISLVKGSFFDGFDDSLFRVCPRLEQVNTAFLTWIAQITKEQL